MIQGSFALQHISVARCALLTQVKEMRLPIVVACLLAVQGQSGDDKGDAELCGKTIQTVLASCAEQARDDQVPSFVPVFELCHAVLE